MEADISILLKTGHFYFALTAFPHHRFRPTLQLTPSGVRLSMAVPRRGSARHGVCAWFLGFLFSLRTSAILRYLYSFSAFFSATSVSSANSVQAFLFALFFSIHPPHRAVILAGVPRLLRPHSICHPACPPQEGPECRDFCLTQWRDLLFSFFCANFRVLSIILFLLPDR